MAVKFLIIIPVAFFLSTTAKAEILTCVDTYGEHILDVNTEKEIWWDEGNASNPGRMKKTRDRQYKFSVWGGEGDVVLNVNKDGKKASIVITSSGVRKGSCVNIPSRIG